MRPRQRFQSAEQLRLLHAAFLMPAPARRGILAEQHEFAVERDDPALMLQGFAGGGDAVLARRIELGDELLLIGRIG